jgi:hypothetical protein
MGKIYRKGKVALCLDKANKGADETAALTLEGLPRKLDAGEDIIIPDDSWRALYEFFTKGWFTRMWVIQEFVLPELHECNIWLDNYKLDPYGLWHAAMALFMMNPTCLSASGKNPC